MVDENAGYGVGRFAGRVAFVTGAAQGIGAATARRLAREGAQVVITDVQQEKAADLADEIDGIAFELDVRDRDQWRAVVAGTLAKAGGVDIFVQNAGWALEKPFLDYDLQEWRAHFELIVEPCFIGMQLLYQSMIDRAESRGGHSAAVFVSSVAGQVGSPLTAPYGSAKAAVRHLSKCLAIEFATSSVPIRVNSIHPGTINTEILKKTFDNLRRQGAMGEGEQAEQWKAMAGLSPMGVIGEPQDIAAGIAYLASDDARYVTGTELTVDGGWTAR